MDWSPQNLRDSTSVGSDDDLVDDDVEDPEHAPVTLIVNNKYVIAPHLGALSEPLVDALCSVFSNDGTVPAFIQAMNRTAEEKVKRCTCGYA